MATRDKHGRFVGASGNPKGRPKGVPNKIPGTMRDKIGAFLEDNFPQIVADFATLRPGQRIRYYHAFLQYCIPRLSTTSIDAISRLDDDQLDTLVSETISAMKNMTSQVK